MPPPPPVTTATRPAMSSMRRTLREDAPAEQPPAAISSAWGCGSLERRRAADERHEARRSLRHVVRREDLDARPPAVDLERRPQHQARTEAENLRRARPERVIL